MSMTSGLEENRPLAQCMPLLKVASNGSVEVVLRLPFILSTVFSVDFTPVMYMDNKECRLKLYFVC